MCPGGDKPTDALEGAQAATMWITH